MATSHEVTACLVATEPIGVLSRRLRRGQQNRRSLRDNTPIGSVATKQAVTSCEVAISNRLAIPLRRLDDETVTRVRAEFPGLAVERCEGYVIAPWHGR